MTDEEKRENVMRGLECCNNNQDCEKCPYAGVGMCEYWLRYDAFNLLKEQEPRVMMKEEIVLCTDWVWCEYMSGYQGWYKMEEYDTDYGLICWEDTTTDIIDDYGFRWRAWTSRPTEEQMRDTPWE